MLNSAHYENLIVTHSVLRSRKENLDRMRWKVFVSDGQNVSSSISGYLVRWTRRFLFLNKQDSILKDTIGDWKQFFWTMSFFVNFKSFCVGWTFKIFQSGLDLARPFNFEFKMKSKALQGNLKTKQVKTGQDFSRNQAILLLA